MTQYRDLEFGEIIEKTDEVFIGGTWYSVPIDKVGQPAFQREVLTPHYRRPLPPTETPASAGSREVPRD